jgi:hypothetical protein
VRWLGDIRDFKPRALPEISDFIILKEPAAPSRIRRWNQRSAANAAVLAQFREVYAVDADVPGRSSRIKEGLDEREDALHPPPILMLLLVSAVRRKALKHQDLKEQP